jgi:hypothetical protein
VEALRSPAVNVPALARRVEASHFPDRTSTCDVVPETTDTESAANTPTGDDDDVNSKSSSQLSPVPGETVAASYRALQIRYNLL